MARGKDAAQSQTPVYSFAIVKFHLPGKDVQFDVAPLKWIQKAGNKTTIYWPSDEDASTSKALLNFISKEAIVNNESWMLYNISVVAKFDTYAGAQKKLASAIDGEVVVSTDLENRGKGGRNKAKKRNADAVTASSTSPDPSTSSKKRTRKDAGNEKEKSCQSEEESDISSQGGHVECDKLSSSDDENTSPVFEENETGALFCLKGQNVTKRCFDKTEVMDLVLESIKSTRGLRRMSEEEIKTKMGRWFKSAPTKIGKDSFDIESDYSSEEK